MLSMASFQPSLKGTFTSHSSFAYNNITSASFKTSNYVNPKANSHIKIKPIRRTQRVNVSATELAPEETLAQEPQMEIEAKPSAAKPKLVLKLVWMEKNIGIGLDQVIAGHGSVPLSPYFFWPRKDAWEELKTTLESKPWISQKKMIILLNQATDIINLWQQSGGNLS